MNKYISRLERIQKRRIAASYLVGYGSALDIAGSVTSLNKAIRVRSRLRSVQARSISSDRTRIEGYLKSSIVNYKG
jgi:hypothetical protein